MDGDPSVHAAPTILNPPSRRACFRCAKSKVRCEFNPSKERCLRCQRLHLVCAAATNVQDDPTVASDPMIGAVLTGNDRRACDRCKHQKTRCNRVDTATPCYRCDKAGVDCITGASKPRGRPTVTSASPRDAQQTLLGAPDAGTDADIEMPLLLPTLVSYASMENGWPDTTAPTNRAHPVLNLESQTLSYGEVSSPQATCLEKLGHLQREILLDLDLLK